ncbi:hypothetical protein Ddye_001237 [Dipteronia dyeriana]|uniref:Uncharacterized protein n=1 Tax=Dipteronia dyeriana TaxID=168575 RepID=A0AAD9XPI1_9ROSI|nr:hypothetical protein Ddye_001237 [Dipteronia dyeriana]
MEAEADAMDAVDEPSEVEEADEPVPAWAQKLLQSIAEVAKSNADTATIVSELIREIRGLKDVVG